MVMRNTQQKKLILDCLQKSSRHMTADEIVDALKVQGVGRATVYRFLKQMEESGQAKKYDAHGRGSACYQYMEDNSGCNEHYHLLCGGCGSLAHVESELIREFTAKIADSMCFQIDDRKIVFYGKCKNCQ